MRIDKAKKLLTEEIDFIFTVSSRSKELFNEFVGDDKVDNICVINHLSSSVSNNIKNTKVALADAKLKLCFIGDGIPHKGAHLIPQALTYLNNCDISVDIWGDFDNDYGRGIRALDENNSIRLRGRYTAAEFQRI